VLLAAGGSRRLGAPKQLLRHRGRPLLVHALTTATAALPGGALVVVLGAHALKLRALVRRTAPRATAVFNARWEEGLATSLLAGLAAAPRDAPAALIMLVDQPHVDAHALRRLLAAWRRRPAVPAAARYAGRAGVPAVLPRRYWRTLLHGLEGDSGARVLLRGAAALTLVDMPEAELDIDTPADAARLRDATASASRSQPAAVVAQLTQPVAPLA
jgi:CTP:molybdopterin cytidylyltransferase MocA